MTPGDAGRPKWWAPGAFVPPGVRGYTRAEAVASVGPGWAGLAARAWDIAAAEAFRVVQVKEKWARLRVYIDAGSRWDSDAARRVGAQLAALEKASGVVCEACGNPGRIWAATDEERARIFQITGRTWIWRRTLCANCGFRAFYEGARGWSAIRGEWHPDDGDDDDEPESDGW